MRRWRRAIAPPLATGENLFSMQDARNLIRHGGLRPTATGCSSIRRCPTAWSSICARSTCCAHGWSPRRCVPHGGHQFALNIAVGLGSAATNSYPQVFAPFGGFADNCKVIDSRVPMPDVPGIGFEAKNELYAVMKGMLQ